MAAVATVSLCLLLAGEPLAAQDSPVIKPPRIAVLSPLGVVCGQKTRVVLRGWSLKDAVVSAPSHPTVSISVVSHAAAAIPDKQKAEQIGDEQLELDVEVPADVVAEQLQFVVKTAAGESIGRRVPLGAAFPLVEEQEPNDGFRQAQQVGIPQVIAGSVHADANVDVYAFEVAQGGAVRIEVEAAAIGSNLDAFLTLLSASGEIIASSDDVSVSTVPAQGLAAAGSMAATTEFPHRDACVQVQLAAGRYLVTLQDAHDRGGPAHPYRLTLQWSQKSDAAVQ
jgi:hypothetical protein